MCNEISIGKRKEYLLERFGIRYLARKMITISRRHYDIRTTDRLFCFYIINIERLEMTEYSYDYWNDADYDTLDYSALEQLEERIKEVEEVKEELTAQIKVAVKLISKFNHPEEYGHLLDSDAKREVMDFLKIYGDYLK
jgi:hypothetical protein